MARKPKCDAPEVHVLGDVVFAFSVLELALEAGIWRMLAGAQSGVRHNMAQLATSKMAVSDKIDAFFSMLAQHNPAVPADEAKALQAALINANRERNALIHSVWNYSNQTGVLTRVRGRRWDIKRTMYPMPYERTREVLDRIEATFDQLGRFRMKYVQTDDNSNTVE